MNGTILLMDTCTESLVVAVAQDGILLAGRRETAGPLKGARLLPLVEEVMQDAGVEYSKLALVAAGRGPGSFTGIRNGLATALGITSALGIPCHGICPLLSLAASQPLSGRKMLAQIDARRHQVYVRLCGFDNRGMPNPLEDSKLLNPEDVTNIYNSKDIYIAQPTDLVMSPEGLLRSFIAQEEQGILGAPTPLYIRPPDASPPTH